MAKWRHIKQGKVEISQSKEIVSFSPAPIKDRLKAFLTDTFMITTPIVYIVIYLVMGSREEFRAHMGEGWLFILIPHYLIVTLFWTLKGQTPGMKAYEIKVVKKDYKSLPNFLQSSLRYFLLLFSIVTLFPLFFIYLHTQKQMLHDILSHTRTIRIDE